MPPTREDWATAFAVQARSDWEVFAVLRNLSAPERVDGTPVQADEPSSILARCHALHYLQMACEKIAKAYRLRDTTADPTDLMKGHVGFAKFMRAFCKAPAIKSSFVGRAAQLRRLEQAAYQLAQEVEKLAPAVDSTGRPDNAEYPWADGEAVIVPAQYPYPNLTLLRQAGGRTFLNVLERAMSGFEELRIY